MLSREPTGLDLTNPWLEGQVLSLFLDNFDHVLTAHNLQGHISDLWTMSQKGKPCPPCSVFLVLRAQISLSTVRPGSFILICEDILLQTVLLVCCGAPCLCAIMHAMLASSLLCWNATHIQRDWLINFFPLWPVVGCKQENGYQPSHGTLHVQYTWTMATKSIYLSSLSS